MGPNQIMQFFTFAHLQGPLRGVSASVAALAREMNADLPESAEKTAGLRKLLEAKDCFVRAALVAMHAQSPAPADMPAAAEAELAGTENSATEQAAAERSAAPTDAGS